MLPWFALYPLIGAALGGGGAKITGKDWKKGALLGAGAGLGAGALPILGGAGAGGSAGWSSLVGATKAPGITSAAIAAGADPAVAAAAGKAAVPAGMNTFGSLLGKGAAPILSKTTAAGAPLASASAGAQTSAASMAKQAAIGMALGQGVSAAMPKYDSTRMLMQPGFMQQDADVMAQLQQLMQKKGVM